MEGLHELVPTLPTWALPCGASSPTSVWGASVRALAEIVSGGMAASGPGARPGALLGNYLLAIITVSGLFCGVQRPAGLLHAAGLCLTEALGQLVALSLLRELAGITALL